jgi:hypothetical protein
MARLDDLADMAMRVAADMARQVKAAADQAENGQAEAGPDAGDSAMAFGRAARAVRLTVLLQGQVIKAILDLDNPPAQQAAKPPEPIYIKRIFVDPAPRGLDGIRPEGREGGEGERLDQDDLHAALRTRSANELVAEVCEDLGHEVDWPEPAEIPGGSRRLGFAIPSRRSPAMTHQTSPRRRPSPPDG